MLVPPPPPTELPAVGVVQPVQNSEPELAPPKKVKVKRSKQEKQELREALARHDEHKLDLETRRKEDLSLQKSGKRGSSARMPPVPFASGPDGSSPTKAAGSATLHRESSFSDLLGLFKEEESKLQLRKSKDMDMSRNISELQNLSKEMSQRVENAEARAQAAENALEDAQAAAHEANNQLAAEEEVSRDLDRRRALAQQSLEELELKSLEYQADRERWLQRESDLDASLAKEQEGRIKNEGKAQEAAEIAVAVAARDKRIDEIEALLREAIIRGAKLLRAKANVESDSADLERRLKKLKRTAKDRIQKERRRQDGMMEAAERRADRAEDRLMEYLAASCEGADVLAEAHMRHLIEVSHGLALKVDEQADIIDALRGLLNDHKNFIRRELSQEVVASGTPEPPPPPPPAVPMPSFEFTIGTDDRARAVQVLQQKIVANGVQQGDFDGSKLSVFDAQGQLLALTAFERGQVEFPVRVVYGIEQQATPSEAHVNTTASTVASPPKPALVERTDSRAAQILQAASETDIQLALDDLYAEASVDSSSAEHSDDSENDANQSEFTMLVPAARQTLLTPKKKSDAQCAQSVKSVRSAQTAGDKIAALLGGGAQKTQNASTQAAKAIVPDAKTGAKDEHHATRLAKNVEWS